MNQKALCQKILRINFMISGIADSSLLRVIISWFSLWGHYLPVIVIVTVKFLFNPMLCSLLSRILAIPVYQGISWLCKLSTLPLQWQKVPSYALLEPTSIKETTRLCLSTTITHDDELYWFNVDEVLWIISPYDVLNCTIPFISGGEKILLDADSKGDWQLRSLKKTTGIAIGGKVLTLPTSNFGEME